MGCEYCLKHAVYHLLTLQAAVDVFVTPDEREEMNVDLWLDPQTGLHVGLWVQVVLILREDTNKIVDCRLCMTSTVW